METRASGESGSEGLLRGAALSAERKLLERVPAGGNSQAVALRLKVGGHGRVDWARPRRFLGPGERWGLSRSASLCATLCEHLQGWQQEKSFVPRLWGWPRISSSAPPAPETSLSQSELSEKNSEQLADVSDLPGTANFILRE